MHSFSEKEIEGFREFRSRLAFPIKGYSVDSRTIEPGRVFVALGGEKNDGHEYLQEVAGKGAVGAIVSKSYTGKPNRLPLWRTEDPLATLQELAADVVRKSRVRTVAITGSIGKTTTKEFVRTLLSARYRVAASPGNQNSQIGVPLSILNTIDLERPPEILILEMGMSAGGQIRNLVRIAPPEVAVLTCVELVHAKFFTGREEIARAKGEIFSDLSTRAGILSADIPSFEEICRIGSCRKISFSLTSSRSDYGVDPNDPSVLQDRAEGISFSVKNFPLPGRHNVHNLLASIAVARYFGLDTSCVQETIPRLSLPPRRLQSTICGNVTFIDDAYNACEPSCISALEVLSESGSGRKIAVIGGMEELGSFSRECHLRVGRFALEHADATYCFGEEAYPIYDLWNRSGKKTEFFLKYAELLDCLKRDLRAGDIVLLKGSFSKGLGKIPEELRSYDFIID